MNSKFIYPILLFFSLVVGAADSARTERLVVHLLNYISSDYEGAVNSQREIKNQFEYDEQLEFIDTALGEVSRHPKLKNTEIHSKVVELKELVLTKSPSESVTRAAQEISEEVIQKTGLVVHPDLPVDLSEGKKLFSQNCYQCHGTTGAGDGPSSSNFNPPPTDFSDPKLKDLGPFHFYNVIKLGVPGTAMAAFDFLSESELWNLSFYVDSLRKGKGPLSDPSTNLFLAKANRFLDESLENYKKGNTSAALERAVSAYLDGVEPLEPKLRLKDATFELALESSFLKIRQGIQKQVSAENLAVLVSESQEKLRQASQLLIDKAVSPWFVFVVSFGIFLREAFEAALLLITLLGVVRTFGSSNARYWIHGGWLTALSVGVVAWFSSEKLLMNSGAQREFLEGGISLFAVLVLLVFGLWMHRQSEIGKWRKFIQRMVALAKDRRNLLVLGFISFLGVFREVFETVLFLRALSLESRGEHETYLFLGVASAFLLVLGLSSWSLKLSKRLPVRKLFQVSSGVMFLLCFSLMGKGVHALQEVGLIPITELSLIPQFRLDWAGIYPFHQTLGAQLGLLLIILLLMRNGKELAAGPTKL